MAVSTSAHTLLQVMRFEEVLPIIAAELTTSILNSSVYRLLLITSPISLNYRLESVYITRGDSVHVKNTKYPRQKYRKVTF